MINNLTSADVANHISMMRSAFKGTILITEGITDSRLYSKFIDKDHVKTIIAHSKSNVKGATMECWKNRKYTNVIGIVDPDLDRFSGKKYDPPLFLSDNRDAETMMLSTHALDDVLTEFADRDKLDLFVKSYGSVRDVVVNRSCQLGLMMYISSRDNLGLKFKDLEYEKFISKVGLQLNLPLMVSEVYSNSKIHKIDKNAMLSLINDEMENVENPWHLARGRDAVEILVIGFKYIFKSYNASGMKKGQLGGALRLAFSFDAFQNTELYNDSLEWSNNQNIPLWINDRN